MISTRRLPVLTFSTTLALLTGSLFFLPSLDDTRQPQAFGLLVLFVLILVFRETAEHTCGENTANEVRHLNQELDQLRLFHLLSSLRFARCPNKERTTARIGGTATGGSNGERKQG
jgi:hypothetical protein